MDFSIYPFYFNYKIMAITNIPKLTKIQTPTPEQMIKTLGVVGGVEYLSQIKDSVKNIEKSLDAKVQQSFSDIKEAENQVTRNLGSRKRRSDFGGTHKKVVPKKASISEKVVSSKKGNSPKEREDSPFKKMVLGVRDSIKKTFSFLKDGFSDFFKDLKEPATKAFQAVLGPLNLILQPLGDLFGKSFSNLFGKIANKFKAGKEKRKVKKEWKEKGKSVKPTDADIKQSNPEIFWLQRKLLGKESKNKEGGGLRGLLDGDIGKMASSLFPMLAKALPIAALVGGLIWGVIDSITAIGKAEGWGVSKVSAGIAGFLAGSGEGGLKDAFKGMGKWALIGAGIGSIVPGIGTIAGGLVGAAIGGILGFIGGEKIAKAFDAIGGWFANAWGATVEWTKNAWSKSVEWTKGAWNKTKEWSKNAWDATKNVTKRAVDTTKKWASTTKTAFNETIGADLKMVFSSVTGVFKDPKKALKSVKDFYKDKTFTEAILSTAKMPFQAIGKSKVVQKLMNTKVGRQISDVASTTFEKALTVGKDSLDYLKNSITKIKSGELSVKDFVKDTVINVFNFIKGGVDTFFKENPLGKWLKKYIMDPITKSFKVIGTFFEFLRDLGVKGIFEVIFSKEDTFASRLEEFGLQKDIEHYSKAGLYNQAYQDARRDVQREAAQMREILSKEELEKRIQKRAVSNLRKVDDAIITPYGRIIEPHKDDTIIATKSPILHRKAGFEPTIKEAESIINTNEIVDNLKTLISVIKDKPFNNVFSTVNQSQVNFAELRMI